MNKKIVAVLGLALTISSSQKVFSQELYSSAPDNKVLENMLRIFTEYVGEYEAQKYLDGEKGKEIRLVFRADLGRDGKHPWVGLLYLDHDHGEIAVMSPHFLFQIKPRGDRYFYPGADPRLPREVHGVVEGRFNPPKLRIVPSLSSYNHVFIYPLRVDLQPDEAGEIELLGKKMTARYLPAPPLK